MQIDKGILKNAILQLLEKQAAMDLELTSFRALMAAVNHSYPEEQLAEKFQGIRTGFLVPTRQRYAPLAAELEKAFEDQKVEEFLQILTAKAPEN